MIVFCNQCGKSVHRDKQKLKRNKHFFCSHGCYSSFRKTIIRLKIRVPWICAQCGKSFEIKPSLAKRHNHHFCSRKCYGKFRTKTFVGSKHSQWVDRIEVVCKECSKIFQVNPNRLKDGRGKFCSKKCLYKYISVEESVSRKGKNNPAWQPKLEVTCLNCGTKLFLTQPQIDRNKRHFCHSECRFAYCVGSKALNWRGGHEPYYGSNWRKQRKLALEREHNTCQRCGKIEDKRKLDVHHITPFYKFKSYIEANSLDNLLTLCHSCHMTVEYPRKQILIATSHRGKTSP